MQFSVCTAQVPITCHLSSSSCFFLLCSTDSTVCAGSYWPNVTLISQVPSTHRQMGWFPLRLFTTIKTLTPAASPISADGLQQVPGFCTQVGDTMHSTGNRRSTQELNLPSSLTLSSPGSSSLMSSPISSKICANPFWLMTWLQVSVELRTIRMQGAGFDDLPLLKA